MHPDGECGDPSAQTCSKDGTSAGLFADYATDYKDASGEAHALCAGSDECCEGGVWGDVMPSDTSGKWLLV